MTELLISSLIPEASHGVFGMLMFAASTAYGVGSAIRESRARAAHARREGERLSHIHLYNSELDEINAQEALRIGRIRTKGIRREGEQNIGTFIAGSGASGTRVDSASVSQVSEYQARLADEEILESFRQMANDFTSFRGSSIHNQYQSRQALIDGRTGAIMARTQGTNQAIGTALSGAGRIYDAYRNWRGS